MFAFKPSSTRAASALYTDTMQIFRPKKIVDPRTGRERIVSPEEQSLLLEKGILLDDPSMRAGDGETRPDTDSL